MANVQNITVPIDQRVTLSAPNENRNYFEVTAKSGNIWVVLEPASANNDQKGVFLQEGERWSIVAVTIYTGEISAIGDGFSSCEASITEY